MIEIEYSPWGDYIFKGKSIILSDMDCDETPLIYFKVFWNDQLTEQIVEQTNIYSFQKLGKTIQVTKEETEQLINI